MKCLATLIFILLGSVSLAGAQTIEQAVPERTRLLFLLDASGSMLARWGQMTRMDAAKYLLANMADSLQHIPELEIGLRIYGHQYPSKEQNCTDSKLEVPFGQENGEQIRQKLKEITPQGTTPLAYSLEQAASDFGRDNHIRNIIILITDGIESCDGDPCRVSEALQRKNVFLQPFVLSLNEEEGDMLKQLSCIGSIYDASSPQKFRDALNTALKQSLGKTTYSLQLLDKAQKPRVSELPYSLYYASTGLPAQQYVHQLNASGLPDTLPVEPVPVYDLFVHSIPATVRKNIVFPGGEHTNLRVPLVQGRLRVNMPNASEYKNGLAVLIYKAGEQPFIHQQPINESVNLLAGTYDIEVLCLPSVRYEKVQIKPDEELKLNLTAPGLLNLDTRMPGAGAIFALLEGEERLIVPLGAENTVKSLALQAGNYRLVYKARGARTDATVVRDFQINSGKTTNINLFGR